MRNVRFSGTLLWPALAALLVLALATTLAQLGPVRADNKTNPRPFDFSDAFYLANGLNPPNIVKRVGTTDPATGLIVRPGDWVFDNSNTDPNRRNVRLLQTTGGFNNSGSLIYYSIMGFVMPNTFTDDAAGAQAQQIANAFRAFIFPKQPNLTSTVCTPTVTTNCVKLDPGVGNRRQDNLFDTRNGYFSNNPLGLWILAFVVYTPAAFNASEGQQALAALAEKNGNSLDQTPIIETADDVNNLVSQGFAQIVNRPLDGSQGFPWVI